MEQVQLRGTGRPWRDVVTPQYRQQPLHINSTGSSPCTYTIQAAAPAHAQYRQQPLHIDKTGRAVSNKSYV